PPCSLHAKKNAPPAERGPPPRHSVAILHGFHQRGGLAVITNRVVIIAERLIAPSASVDRHSLFIAFAETPPGRRGLAELFDGLAQRVRRFAGAQLLGLTDGVDSRDAPLVFI